jgi:hypothetical protein
MATKFSNTLQMSNSTDALFRAWVQFVDDLFLVTGLWLNTTDTGQMTIASATHPGTTNAKVGYRIYKMNDALQATAPCFVRVDYGSGSAANTPGMFWTIGTGTNGSGTITGQLFSSGATPLMTAGANGTNACNSYGSADTNRLQGLMFVRSAATDVMIFGIERTKDTNGNDTATGFLVFGQDGANGLALNWYILATPGTQPPGERINMLISGTAPTFGPDAGVGLLGYFAGALQPFGLGAIAVNSGDFAAEGTVTLSLYGSSHTFQLGNSATNQVFLNTGPGTATARGATRCGIRYE